LGDAPTRRIRIDHSSLQKKAHRTRLSQARTHRATKVCSFGVDRAVYRATNLTTNASCLQGGK
jgi:hypothetical protein